MVQTDWQQLLQRLLQHDVKLLARTISLIENEAAGYEEFLQQLPSSGAGIIGITGPLGAGKSTLTDALIGYFIQQNFKVAVLCIDPASPFHHGALLGDRIRMSKWYNNTNVFIRSLSSKGSMGGLHPKIIELSDVLKAYQFDFIIIETVGVGQSELEIANLADATVVVLVPESGDEIQTMKAGLMEIADVFAVNKSDRPGADSFVNNLRRLHPPNHPGTIPVIKTIASQNEGVAELYEAIQNHLKTSVTSEKKYALLADKAYQLMQHQKMKNINKTDLKNAITQQDNGSFNLYRFVKNYLK